MIQGVLSHIQVIDNCRKFALFERTDEGGEGGVGEAQLMVVVDQGPTS